MSKRLYSDIELLMKQLSDADQPAFDEQAWHKMEQLLDKENETRKPLLFWWWLLPVMIFGGVIVYFSTNNTARHTDIVFLDKNKKNKEYSGQNVLPQIKTASAPVTNSALKYSKTGKWLANKPTLTKLDELLQKGGGAAKAKIVKTVLNVNKTKFEGSYATLPNAFHQADILPNETDRMGLPVIEKVDSSSGKIIIEEEPVERVIAKVEKDTQERTNPDTATQNSPVSQPVKISQSRSHHRGVYFLAGAGAEMNGLKFLPSGKLAARIGFGLGYQFTQRISLQSGFYTSSKKYTAGANDYKVKAGSYWSTVDIKRIEANCRVYEIPLSVRYDFKGRRKINYFSSIGLSSFLMKKEDYQYYYEYYGTPNESHASYTGNRHLLSVLRFAAGIERNITPQVSIHLSPGFSVPLAGVGEGQVKLFSTDMLFGIKFSPAVKKEN